MNIELQILNYPNSSLNLYTMIKGNATYSDIQG